MTTPDGNSADMIYEQILDNARREIEDALAIIDELRQSIRQVEARVEAAQSIYNAVTARLNLEDELAEEIHMDLPPVAPPEAAPEPAPPSEPPEPEEPAAKMPAPAEPVAEDEIKDDARLDMIQKSLEERDKAASVPTAQPPESLPEEEADDPVLSRSERVLISEHLRSKRKG